MGNTCCCSCSAPDQVDYEDIFDKVVDVEDTSHIDELISYIDQLLNACIDQGSIQSIARLAKTNRVAASINSGGGLLEKILKRSNRHLCKRDIVPNLNRETRKLVIDVTNLAAQIKWVGVAFSVVGFVLERIEQISSNRDDCIQLLKYMCNLAKYIKQLEDHLAQEKLNRVLQFIVECNHLAPSSAYHECNLIRFPNFFLLRLCLEICRNCKHNLVTRLGAHNGIHNCWSEQD